MIDQAALDTKLAEMQAKKVHFDEVEYPQLVARKRQLLKEVKAEIPRAINRQRKIGWPDASEERVGEFRRKKDTTVKLVLLYGDPLTSALDESQFVPYLLGEDGCIYTVNIRIWRAPEPGLPPYSLWDFTWANVNQLASILEKLKSL